MKHLKNKSGTFFMEHGAGDWLLEFDYNLLENLLQL